MRTWLKRGLVGLAGALLVAQVVPYGRDHHNPPVLAEPRWSSPRVRELTVRACYDCHSNETRWPWYSHVAPISWLVQWDVVEGRRVLNYSEMTRPQPDAKESGETVAEREMPPWYYPLLHPEASLSDSERAFLVEGLDATFGRGLGEAPEARGRVGP